VIELKINSTPQVALRQLEEMNYAVPFAMDGRELVKLGVNFSTEAFMAIYFGKRPKVPKVIY
jgi:hypothetical protein